jgi:hypothetical protein
MHVLRKGEGLRKGVEPGALGATSTA